MKKIVVIAHDKHKPDMCAFLNDRAPWFYGRNIIATGRTAEYLEKHFTFDKNLQKSNEKGHLGGMDAEDLKILKKITSEIELIGNKPNKIK